MNTKHLACVVLFLVVGGLLQLTVTLHRRWVTAMDAARDSEDRLAEANRDRDNNARALKTIRRETAARRKYLDMWRQTFDENGTERNAKSAFEAVLKRFNLPQFETNTTAATENKEMTYVNRRMASTVKLEGDAEKAVHLLSAIERDLPTSRISMLELRKGQRANDVEVNLTVEFPLVVQPVIGKK